MHSTKVWSAVGRIYDAVHLALWASLLAFVIYFVTVVFPNIPAAQARWDAKRIHEVADEHEFYCSKWGMGIGSRANAQCILDLQAFRAKVEERLTEDDYFF